MSDSLDNDIVWNWPFTVAPTQQVVSATTWTNTLRAPIWLMDASTPGANKIAEFGCVLHDLDSPLEIKLYKNSGLVRTWQDYEFHIEAFMGCYTTKANLTNTQYVGIEYGSIDQSPPFTDPTSGGVAQLRWVAGTDSFQLYTAKGDGTPAVAITLNDVSNIYGTDNIPHGVLARLVIDWPKQELRAYINGVLGATYKGVAFPTEPFSHGNGASHSIISGVFATTGTSSLGATKAHFSTFSHRIKRVRNFSTDNMAINIPR